MGWDERFCKIICANIDSFQITVATVKAFQLTQDLSRRLNGALDSLVNVTNLHLANPTVSYGVPRHRSIKVLRVDSLVPSCDNWGWLRSALDLQELDIRYWNSSQKVMTEGAADTTNTIDEGESVSPSPTERYHLRTCRKRKANSPGSEPVTELNLYQVSKENLADLAQLQDNGNLNNVS